MGRALQARVRHLDGTLCIGNPRNACFGEKQKKEGRSWVAVSGPLSFVHGYSKISMGVCSELCGTLSLHTFEGTFSQQTLNPS